MNRSKKLFQATILVMMLYAFNKVLGVARVLLVGRAFGTGKEMDAFTAANQLPELFYVLIAGGALAAALIPVYTQYLEKDRQNKTKQSQTLANATFTMVMLFLIMICALAALFAPFITRSWLVPHYSAEQQLLTASLMQIILLNTVIFGISGVVTSLLNAHQHFLLPALAPIMLDVGYLIGLFFLVPHFGIYGLAWGTVIGAGLHLVVQLPGLVIKRLKISLQLDFNQPGVREIIRLMGPRIVMLGCIQFADLFWVRVASSLPEGSLSGYNYAFTLMQLPETLFGTAIAIVLFPTLAEMYNQGNIEGVKRTAMIALRIIWLLTIPSAIGLVFLGQPAIALLLERNAFTADSTALVYTILIFFSVRIISEATLEVVARLFYARHNTITPMYAYIVWLIINVGGIYLLVSPLGVGGIALASTVAFTALASILFILNQQQLGSLIDDTVRHSIGRIFLASLAMTLTLLLLRQLQLPSLLYLALGTGISAIVYFLTNWLLGGAEIKLLFSLLRRGK